MIKPSQVEQEYENLLNRDKTIYGTSYEKVTFDEKTGTLIRQRLDPMEQTRKFETGSEPVEDK